MCIKQQCYDPRSYSRALIVAACCCCCWLPLAGCQRESAADPVEPQLALSTLQAVLQDWKENGSADAWRTRSPEVVVQDWDWSGGTKLKDFRILGTGEARDANLYCRVELVLQKPGQSVSVQTVTYVVGTDPVLTVFRGMPE